MKSISENTVLVCPICKSILRKDEVNEKTYKCEKNHSYDIAKEGYVNLLISNQKRSKNPGDSKEMVLARIDFLNRNYYTKLEGNQNPYPKSTVIFQCTVIKMERSKCYFGMYFHTKKVL